MELESQDQDEACLLFGYVNHLFSFDEKHIFIVSVSTPRIQERLVIN